MLEIAIRPYSNTLYCLKEGYVGNVVPNKSMGMSLNVGLLVQGWPGANNIILLPIQRKYNIIVQLARNNSKI